MQIKGKEIDENNAVWHKIMGVKNNMPHPATIENLAGVIGVSHQALSHIGFAAYQGELSEEQIRYFAENSRADILTDAYKKARSIISENEGLTRREYADMLIEAYGAKRYGFLDGEARQPETINHTEPIKQPEQMERYSRMNPVLARRQFWQDYARR